MFVMNIMRSLRAYGVVRLLKISIGWALTKFPIRTKIIGVVDGKQITLSDLAILDLFTRTPVNKSREYGVPAGVVIDLSICVMLNFQDDISSQDLGYQNRRILNELGKACLDNHQFPGLKCVLRHLVHRKWLR